LVEPLKKEAVELISNAMALMLKGDLDAGRHSLANAISALNDRKRQLGLLESEWLQQEHETHSFLLDAVKQSLTDLSMNPFEKHKFVLSELAGLKKKLKPWLGRKPSKARSLLITDYLRLLYQGLNGISSGKQIQIQLIPIGKALAAGQAKESIKLMNSLKL
ncbi:hypothetical protein HZB89_01090, partial [archaeon]|nr:hypothetical protein [archaeon]